MQFSGRVFCNLALLSCTILTKTLIGHTSMERTSKHISGRMSKIYRKKIEELWADFGNSKANAINGKRNSNEVGKTLISTYQHRKMRERRNQLIKWLANFPFRSSFTVECELSKLSNANFSALRNGLWFRGIKNWTLERKIQLLWKWLGSLTLPCQQLTPPKIMTSLF